MAISWCQRFVQKSRIQQSAPGIQLHTGTVLVTAKNGVDRSAVVTGFGLAGETHQTGCHFSIRFSTISLTTGDHLRDSRFHPGLLNNCLGNHFCEDMARVWFASPTECQLDPHMQEQLSGILLALENDGSIGSTMYSHSSWERQAMQWQTFQDSNA